MKLRTFLQKAGVGSRRFCDRAIIDGRVRVNGKVVREPWFEVDPERDTVYIGKKQIKLEDHSDTTFAFYKPAGVSSTLYDKHAEKTIADYVKDIGKRVFPVGRLDRDSEGLMILTNNGKLANILTHPRYQIEKEYIVSVEGGKINRDVIKRLSKGVYVDHAFLKPHKVQLLHSTGTSGVFKIVLREGKKREIRRIFKKLGFEVKKLKRIRIGNYILPPNLKPGEMVKLSRADIRKLKMEKRRRS